MQFGDRDAIQVPAPQIISRSMCIFHWPYLCPSGNIIDQDLAGEAAASRELKHPPSLQNSSFSDHAQNNHFADFLKNSCFQVASERLLCIFLKKQEGNIHVHARAKLFFSLPKPQATGPSKQQPQMALSHFLASVNLK